MVGNIPIEIFLLTNHLLNKSFFFYIEEEGLVEVILSTLMLIVCTLFATIAIQGQAQYARGISVVGTEHVAIGIFNLF